MSSIRKLIVASVLYFGMSTSGCATETMNPTVVYFGNDTSLDLVESAARSWDRCGAHITIVTRGQPGADDADYELVEMNGLVLEDDKDPSDTSLWAVGITRRADARIEFAPQSAYPLAPTAGVIAHEFGHMLGAGHVEAGLMQADGMGPSYLVPTDEDCAALR